MLSSFEINEIEDELHEELPGIRAERLLLILAGAFLLINFLALGLLRAELASSSLITLGVWGLCAGCGHLVLNLALPRRDPMLFPLAMLLAGWGLVINERLLPTFADRQTVWLLIAVGAMLAAAALPHLLHWLRTYRYLLLTVGIALLLSTILLGSNPSGQAGTPRLWLGLGDVYFQPSEPMKIILVAFLASYLAEQYPVLRASGLVSGNRILALSPQVLGPVLLMWGLSMVILVWQRDLGTAVLFFAAFLVLLYVASGHAAVLFVGAGLIIVAGIAAYALFDVVALRVDVWLNPWPEADSRAYQIVQSMQAFAAGSVFGEGVGQGYPMYVPVAHSDFAFAALAEEWGLLGVLTVIVAFAVIVLRGLNTAVRRQSRPFLALLGIGLSLMLGLQAVLIMGGTVRLLPLTGVTLPFVSYGGSSLLTSFIMIGLLLRIATPKPARNSG